MSDGKNNQEFQMGQLEEKHAEDDHKKVLDSLKWEWESSPVTSKCSHCSSLVQSSMP